MPISTWVSMKREVLKRKVKRKDIPILCEGHSVELTKGDMALVDHNRCEKCFPPLTTWPPPKPKKVS